MVTKKTDESGEITIMEVVRGEMDFNILGTSPLIMNRMSQKVWFELLVPKGKKNAAERASSLKHRPRNEFHNAAYWMPNEDAPTLLALLPTMFKRAMGTAALDMPGVQRAQILRHIYARGEFQPVYGIPKLFMAITRSADIKRTPDVRTRVILPEWACRLTISFPQPLLRPQSIGNLLSAAGLVSGVGDWRQEKGSGSYGAFRLASFDDPDFMRITSEQGRAAQQEAIEKADPYNDETSEMMAWYDVEIKKRGFTADGKKDEAAPTEARIPKTRRKPNGGDDMAANMGH